MFDMNQCKVGDQLFLRNGDIVTYLCNMDQAPFYSPSYHIQLLGRGLTESRDDNGRVGEIDDGRDVIGFVKSPAQRAQEQEEDEQTTKMLDGKMVYNPKHHIVKVLATVYVTFIRLVFLFICGFVASRVVRMFLSNPENIELLITLGYIALGSLTGAGIGLLYIKCLKIKNRR